MTLMSRIIYRTNSISPLHLFGFSLAVPECSLRRLQITWLVQARLLNHFDIAPLVVGESVLCEPGNVLPFTPREDSENFSTGTSSHIVTLMSTGKGEPLVSHYEGFGTKRERGCLDFGESSLGVRLRTSCRESHI